MSRHLLIVLLVAAAAAGESGLGHAVNATAVMPWIGPDCYAPVVIDLDPAEDSALAITIGDDDGGATMRVSVQAHRRQRVTVPWPGGNGYGCMVTIVDHRSRRLEVSTTSRSIRDRDLMLIDPDESVSLKELRSALGRTLAGVALPNDRYRSGSAYPDERADRLAAEHLPDRWQCYPWWLTIAITRSGEAAIDPAQRQALVRWSRNGGGLLVEDGAQAELWRAQGAIVAVGIMDAARLVRPRLRDDADDAPPVPGTDRVPVLGFVCVALLFAILVGPVNLWWVRRQGKRRLFLITTPIISGVTCLVLIVVSLVADGIGVRRTAVQVVALDGVNHQAVAWTGVSYFCGLPIGAIPLDSEDQVIVAKRDESGGGRHYRRGPSSTTGLTLDWTDGQTARGGWLPARINRSLRYTQVRPENRRLLVEAEGSGWKMTNGLGVGIQRLVWKDGAGGLWTCTGLDDGRSASLEPLSQVRIVGEGMITAFDLATRTMTTARLERLGSVGVSRPWQVFSESAHGFQAILTAPLLPIPGPAGTDVESVQSWVCGDLPPASAAAPATGKGR